LCYKTQLEVEFNPVTTIQTSEQIKKKSTSTAAAMRLASSNERFVLPPNMNMAVKSANAAGTIAVSVPFMNFYLRKARGVGDHLAHRRHPFGLPWNNHMFGGFAIRIFVGPCIDARGFRMAFYFKNSYITLPEPRLENRENILSLLLFQRIWRCNPSSD
jgi:hypothetical protein